MGKPRQSNPIVSTNPPTGPNPLLVVGSRSIPRRVPKPAAQATRGVVCRAANVERPSETANRAVCLNMTAHAGPCGDLLAHGVRQVCITTNSISFWFLEQAIREACIAASCTVRLSAQAHRLQSWGSWGGGQKSSKPFFSDCGESTFHKRQMKPKRVSRRSQIMLP